MAIELLSGGARAVILPEYGGRLQSLTIPLGGAPAELLWQPPDLSAYDQRPTRGGSFPMAPWPNRIREGRFDFAGRIYEVPLDGRPHALHGRVFQRPWQVVARTARIVELSCPFDDGWPWAGRAWQRFELSDGRLQMKLEVRSERDLFPAGCGWHPWFRRQLPGGAPVRVQVPASRRYILEGGIPTGETVAPVGEFDLRAPTELGQRRLDDCYAGLEGPLVADWGVLQLAMTVEAPEPHVQVFTPEYAFCLEPQTAAPDAFNLAARGIASAGMGIARPGRAVAIESRWTWQVAG